MKVLILTCSPNKDGLTAACGNAAREGVESAGGEAVTVRLNDLNIDKCHACNDGWGTCKPEHRCQVKDDFQALHQLVGEIDAYVVVTPVYFDEMSESLKSFLDRLRRSEATTKEGKTRIDGKPFICIAAAGGPGFGTLSCLTEMEQAFLRMSHIRPEKFEYIGITRWTRPYMLEAIRAAAGHMVSGQA